MNRDKARIPTACKRNHSVNQGVTLQTSLRLFVHVTPNDSYTSRRRADSARGSLCFLFFVSLRGTCIHAPADLLATLSARTCVSSLSSLSPSRYTHSRTHTHWLPEFGQGHKRRAAATATSSYTSCRAFSSSSSSSSSPQHRPCSSSKRPSDWRVRLNYSSLSPFAAEGSATLRTVNKVLLRSASLS